MNSLILHHYDGSPFSEKVRLMLGFKGLAWRSVKVPVIQCTAGAAADAQTADGRAFLFGTEASIADFSVAHNLWYVRRGGPVAAILDPHRHLMGWFDRLLAFGHGRPEPMSSADSLAVAAAATPLPVQVAPGLGFDAGQSVTVTPTDYGCDPVVGTLVGLSGVEVVIRRHDERAGTVHVHFPRAGFQIKQEQT